MSDDASRSNVLSYIGSGPVQRARATTHDDLNEWPDHLSAWSRMWMVVAAHVVELRRAEVIDDAGFVAVAGSLLSVRESSDDKAAGPRSQLSTMDARIESQIPPSVSGAATLGLAREEWLATVARLIWRDTALHVMKSLLAVSEAAQVLAETHVVTIMPAFTGGRAVQPTTLAHFLGALISPLAGARARMRSAFDGLNRSPLGASLMSGDVLAADREELATRLGFSEPVPNTLDALASVEDFVGMLDAISSGIAPLARFVHEMRTWIRTDPMSFVLDEGWSTIPEPSHPSLLLSERLDVLAHDLDALGDAIDGWRREWRRLDYGPLGAAWDSLIRGADELSFASREVLSTSTTLLATGLVVNRAYLGNRAGRGYTTAGDLATFLMTEEQIPPTAARRIAVLVLAALKDTGMEVSGISPDMIDSAALMTIGREIKVEMEVLGRFLAPRRYIERRLVTGSPAPEMAREWLANERRQLGEDRAWLESTTSAMDSAVGQLAASIEAAAGDSPEG